MLGILSKLSVNRKLQILSLLSFIALIFVTIFLLFEQKHSLLHDRQEKTEQVVNIAHSLVQQYVAMEKSGELSTFEAKKQAMERIKALRYEGSNYFWINDTFPRMIMHPIKPQLDGKDLTKVKDPDGKYLGADT